MPTKPTYFTAHFRIEELARCHDGTLAPAKYMPNLQELAIELELIRKLLGARPITVISGWRSPAWNKKVEGMQKSQHLVGRAADIVVPGLTPGEVADKLEAAMKAGDIHNGGLGRYDTFTHYDIRPRPARWDLRSKAG